MSRIRRVIAALAMGAALALPLALAGQSPAHAGNGYWSDTSCWPQSPYESEWFGTPGTGSRYRNIWTPGGYLGQGQMVGGKIYQYYAARQFECGHLGLVYQSGSAVSSGISYNYVFFIRPGSCSLRYVIEITSGTNKGQVAEAENKNYFCIGA